MDDLSVALNNSGIGGNLGDAFLNHLCYTDDICLISLSSDNVVRYYIVIYSMYGFVTFVAYLFSSICVIMKITLFSKLYYLFFYMNKLVIQIRNL